MAIYIRLVKKMYRRFIKKEKMDNVNNGRNLFNIDVSETNNLTAKNIEIEFGASAACKH